MPIMLSNGDPLVANLVHMRMFVPTCVRACLRVNMRAFVPTCERARGYVRARVCVRAYVRAYTGTPSMRS